MTIAVLCTDSGHPVMPSLRQWAGEMTARGHQVSLYHDKGELIAGDILFLVSCSQVIRQVDRDKFKATLVLHGSDLPRGRGWSPYIWAVVNGASTITLSLFEAADSVDTGDIWVKTTFQLAGHALLAEITARLFEAEVRLMTEAVERFGSVVPVPQSGAPGPSMPKRTPADSRLDPHRTIADQFNLLRVVDNDRYPAFFELHGRRYVLRIDHDERA